MTDKGRKHAISNQGRSSAIEQIGKITPAYALGHTVESRYNDIVGQRQIHPYNEIILITKLNPLPHNTIN